MVRWLPLAMIVTWIGLVRVRMEIQLAKYGRPPVHVGKDRGQRAREAGARLATLAQLVVAILVVTGRCDLATTPLQRAAGLTLGFGGAILMFVAQLQMGASWRIGIDPDARTPLVTHGWYRWSRNPIYVFVVITFIGFALLVPNVVTWLVAALTAIGFRAQALREEKWLVATFGDEWREYARRVGRFVPLLGRVS